MVLNNHDLIQCHKNPRFIFIAMILYWNLPKVHFFIEKMCLAWEKPLLNQSSEKYKLLPSCNALDPLRVPSRFLELPRLISIELQRTQWFFVCENTLPKKSVVIAVLSFLVPEHTKGFICTACGTGHRGLVTSWCEPSLCPGDKGQQCLGCMRRSIGRGGQRGPFPLLSPGERCLQCWGQFWSCHYQGVRDTPGAHVGKDHEGDWSVWDTEKGSEPETVQPGEGKVQGGKYQLRGVKKRESSFSQWYSVAGQEAMGIN